MSKFLQNLVAATLFYALYFLYRLNALTWRVRHVNRPQVEGPIIYGHFHQDELLLLQVFCKQKMGVMASLSNDGEIQAKLLSRLGYEVVRGSSSRAGARGLKGLVDLVLGKKRSASLAVDGPRGPLYQVKEGLLKLGQLTQRPIVVGACASSRAYIFKKAWNKCFMPYPFSRNVICYSEPFLVSSEVNEDEFERIRLSIEKKLAALKLEALKALS